MWLEDGAQQSALPASAASVYLQKEKPEGVAEVPSHREVSEDKAAYARAFMAQYTSRTRYRGVALLQQQDDRRWLVQTPPASP
jgi:hypothetical protein